MFMAKQTMRLLSDEVDWQRQQRISPQFDELLDMLPSLSVEEWDTSLGMFDGCDMMKKLRMRAVVGWCSCDVDMKTDEG